MAETRTQPESQAASLTTVAPSKSTETWSGVRLAAEPFITFRSRVEADWVDMNGHMASRRYQLVAESGSKEMFTVLGLRASLGASGSFFQAELHTIFERELRVGAPIAVRSWLVAIDAKRVHHFHEVCHEEAGYRAASIEIITLRIDLATRRTAAIDPDVVAALSRAIAARTTPLPATLGRGISMQKRAVVGTGNTIEKKAPTF